MSRTQTVKIATLPLVSGASVTYGDFVKLSSGAVQKDTTSFSSSVYGMARATVSDNSATTGLTDYVPVMIEGRVPVTGLVEGSGGTYTTAIAVGDTVSMYVDSGVQYVVKDATNPIGRVVSGSVASSGGVADTTGTIEIELNLEFDSISLSEIPDGGITTAKLEDDILSADTAGRAKMQDGFFNQATANAKIADGSLQPSLLHNDAKFRTINVRLHPLPAPTGSNQLAQITPLLKIPSNGTIVSCQIISNTATSSSDAASEYVFKVINSTQTNDITATPVGTSSAELAQYTYYDVPVEQNQDVQSGDIIALNVDIEDDGTPNPTDLSSAVIDVQLVYRPRD